MEVLECGCRKRKRERERKSVAKGRQWRRETAGGGSNKGSRKWRGGGREQKGSGFAKKEPEAGRRR